MRNGRLNAWPASVNCHMQRRGCGRGEGGGNRASLLSVISVVRLRLKREPFLTCFSPEAYEWFRNLYRLGIQKGLQVSFSIRLILRLYHFESGVTRSSHVKGTAILQRKVCPRDTFPVQIVT